jgi:hypothetical protein
MSICYHGAGSILLKGEKKEEFAKKFAEFTEKLKPENWTGNDKGLYQFILYWRWPILDTCENMLKENIEYIEGAQIDFDCTDEDGCIDRPFPKRIYMEVTDGQVFREELNTRMPFDWGWYFCDNNEWFHKIYEEKEKERERERQKEEAEKKQKQTDEFPF